MSQKYLRDGLFISEFTDAVNRMQGKGSVTASSVGRKLKKLKPSDPQVEYRLTSQSKTSMFLSTELLYVLMERFECTDEEKGRVLEALSKPEGGTVSEDNSSNESSSTSVGGDSTAQAEPVDVEIIEPTPEDIAFQNAVQNIPEPTTYEEAVAGVSKLIEAGTTSYALQLLKKSFEIIERDKAEAERKLVRVEAERQVWQDKFLSKDEDLKKKSQLVDELNEKTISLERKQNELTQSLEQSSSTIADYRNQVTNLNAVLDTVSQENRFLKEQNREADEERNEAINELNKAIETRDEAIEKQKAADEKQKETISKLFDQQQAIAEANVFTLLKIKKELKKAQKKNNAETANAKTDQPNA